MVRKFKLAKYIFSLAIAISAVVTFGRTSMTAERIDFNFSLLGFNLKVKGLGDFRGDRRSQRQFELLFSLFTRQANKAATQVSQSKL